SSTTQPPAPAVRVLFNPETVEPILTRFAQRESGGRVPGWLLDAVLPYEAAAVATYDFGTHRIEMNALLNARRLDGVIARAFPLDRLRREVPEIDWAADGVQRPRRGLVTLPGTAPMDPKVEEDVWSLWQHAIALPPLDFEGGHMLEAVFDNRTGGAWLVIGSLFRAFDIELDE